MSDELYDIDLSKLPRFELPQNASAKVAAKCATERAARIVENWDTYMSEVEPHKVAAKLANDIRSWPSTDAIMMPMPLTVWAVVFGNYSPREIDSLWTNSELADKRAEALGGMWEVAPMRVHNNFDEVEAEDESD